MTDWEAFRAELLSDPETHKEYDTLMAECDAESRHWDTKVDIQCDLGSIKVDIGAGRKLDTDEAYARFSRFIDEKIQEVADNPDKALEALVGTGMYDENGVLKDEFRQ